MCDFASGSKSARQTGPESFPLASDWLSFGEERLDASSFAIVALEAAKPIVANIFRRFRFIRESLLSGCDKGVTLMWHVVNPLIGEKPAATRRQLFREGRWFTGKGYGELLGCWMKKAIGPGLLNPA